MGIQAEQLKQRTKDFAVRVVRAIETLPRKPSATVIGRQVLRSATSIAANYRAACRSRSRGEFIAKLGLVIEEADETAFWLEMLVDTALIPPKRMAQLIDEANQLVAIFTASKRTAETAKSTIDNRQSEMVVASEIEP
jgi:four helix bundle protein